MDKLYNGKTYEQMDDLGGFPIIFGGPPKCSFADDFSVDFILPISYHWSYSLRSYVGSIVGVPTFTWILLSLLAVPKYRLHDTRLRYQVLFQEGEAEFCAMSIVKPASQPPLSTIAWTLAHSSQSQLWDAQLARSWLRDPHWLVDSLLFVCSFPFRFLPFLGLFSVVYAWQLFRSSTRQLFYGFRHRSVGSWVRA